MKKRLIIYTVLNVIKKSVFLVVINCRYTNNKHIKLFNKNEITSIYTDTLTQLSVLHKHNDILINNYNYLYNENKRLKDEINNKNSEIIEIKELLLSNKNDVEQLENY